jgi:hypothetical protein
LLGRRKRANKRDEPGTEVVTLLYRAGAFVASGGARSRARRYLPRDSHLLTMSRFAATAALQDSTFLSAQAGTWQWRPVRAQIIRGTSLSLVSKSAVVTTVESRSQWHG